MHFEQIDRIEYEKNILFEVIFQARFPEIMKISREEPADFQDIIRKEGFPETGSNFQNLPQDMPEEFKKILTFDKEFYFFSEEGDWQVSLTRNFIALSCKGNYLNYQDFRGRLKKFLEIFNKVYEPTYFSRIGLRYRNIVNEDILPLNEKSVKDCIPVYIFPELKQPIAEDLKTLEKITQLDDGNIKANVTHTLTQVTGKFRQEQINNKKSYLIDIDCFSENKIKGIDNALAKCDEFKNNEWNIFQWSITDTLREAMGAKRN
ncbi:TIGR04255 family protein [Methyloglobulus sp.]|uniref:TIGR04255 family protein n=1 Tax=Methyloglobulus sp. TaxID=2518622 RepID=UPI003989CD9A